MSEADLIAALENRSLEPAMLTHRNHILIAWLYLRRMPLAVASLHFRDVMRAYVSALGLASEFHQTLSESMVRLIHARMAMGQGWEEFERLNGELFLNAKSVLARHYSAAQLERGRRVFVEPDILALP